MSNSVTYTLSKTAPKAQETMDIACDRSKIDSLIKARVGATPVVANLVEQKDVAAPQVYKRFNDANKKNQYRAQLVAELETKWVKTLGPEKGKKMTQKFVELASHLDDNGALVLGAILSSKDFQKLIEAYSSILVGSGSKSWIHAYVNLANHPDFLTNKEFNAAFMHPLLIALVSHRVGGPVRIVDVRGKDAEPISVLAQDNMLHIDNTPFNDEYKIILVWERGKPSGPKGQNFVFLPGTHKGARQCMVGNEGPWSSENASIFTTPESVEKVLTFQESIYGKRAVVELTHDTKPLTTLFGAGSLVHHRHRTNEGLARSCMILAFHRTEDNQGQLIDQKYVAKETDELFTLLLTDQRNKKEGAFIAALLEKTDEMADIMLALQTGTTDVEEIVPSARELKGQEIEQWKKVCTIAPTVEEKKSQASVVPLGKSMDHDTFVESIGNMMVYDKHGPLDLILYPDAHEEIRKWARNQIREKNINLLKSQLQDTWSEAITTPSETDLLSPIELQKLANELASIAVNKAKTNTAGALLQKGEKISPADAYRSVHQLLLNLGESIVRCEDRTAFLSTSLFIFWAADTLMRFEEKHDKQIKMLGSILLKNYVATAVVVEKQRIQNTKK
ncbi:MAG: hypothetical protein JSR58_02980 [Verrucomicrobia bacterium]|nr:hypothetical protein [Verrucomicrobiota bacterium]